MGEHPAFHWAWVWQRAWEAGDADAVAALYAPDATFWTEPFREPLRGPAGARDYACRAFAAEAEVRAWFGMPVVEGDRAAVEWWAALREDGAEVTLAGTSVLRFDADGLVTEQRDTWNQASGRLPPPAGWGAKGVATG